MSYVYNPGDPVSVLLPSEPPDAGIVGDTADESLRQIKAYLLDQTKGPNSRYTALLARFNALQASIGGAGGLPAGLIASAGGTPPAGWLLCDGQLVSRTTYATLFAAVGVAYGQGDGSTTFALPDLRGRVACSVDLTFTVNTQAAALAAFGEDSHVLTVDEMGPHTHTPGDEFPASQLSFLCPGNGVNIYTANGAYNMDTAAESLANEGGGSSHNNIQPSLVVNYIIKT